MTKPKHVVCLTEEQISTVLYVLEGYVQGNDDEELVEEIDDIFNPNTPARSIRTLNGEFRVKVIDRMLEQNMTIIKSEVMSKLLNK